MAKARGLSIERLEMVARVMLGVDTSRMTSAELKRDVYLSVKKNPSAFLNALKNPELEIESKVQMFLSKKLINYRNNGQEAFLNTPTNKKKLMSMPYGVDPIVAIVGLLKTAEGSEILKLLEDSAKE
jgi:hypothetical protein